MSYESATDLMGDVRRWDVNEWELRDVTAEVYWVNHSGPGTAELERAVQSIDDQAGHGDERAVRASQFLERAQRDIETAARMSLERNTRGERIEDSQVQAWVRRAKVAVLYAIAGYLAEPWISRAELDTLTAAYRAADERLDFDFILETRDKQEWDAAMGFLDDIVAGYPGTAATFDPPHRRPPHRFDVISTAYVSGDPAEARDRLLHDLEGLLRRRDPDQRLPWPPFNFNSRRPSRFGTRG
jgi:hypothetical protein